MKRIILIGMLIPFFAQAQTKTSVQNILSKVSSATASTTSVGADIVWDKITSVYNNIPLVAKVNPDLKSYVTGKTLDGVFKMISIEEKNIRTQPVFRTTSLLKSVFALQDGTKK